MRARSTFSLIFASAPFTALTCFSTSTQVTPSSSNIRSTPSRWPLALRRRAEEARRVTASRWRQSSCASATSRATAASIAFSATGSGRIPFRFDRSDERGGVSRPFDVSRTCVKMQLCVGYAFVATKRVLHAGAAAMAGGGFWCASCGGAEVRDQPGWRVRPHASARVGTEVVPDGLNDVAARSRRYGSGAPTAAARHGRAGQPRSHGRVARLLGSRQERLRARRVRPVCLEVGTRRRVRRDARSGWHAPHDFPAEALASRHAPGRGQRGAHPALRRQVPLPLPLPTRQGQGLLVLPPPPARRPPRADYKPGPRPEPTSRTRDEHATLKSSTPNQPGPTCDTPPMESANPRELR